MTRYSADVKLDRSSTERGASSVWYITKQEREIPYTHKDALLALVECTRATFQHHCSTVGALMAFVLVGRESFSHPEFPTCAIKTGNHIVVLILLLLFFFL